MPVSFKEGIQHRQDSFKICSTLNYEALHKAAPHRVPASEQVFGGGYLNATRWICRTSDVETTLALTYSSMFSAPSTVTLVTLDAAPEIP
jgi:hypothetical protein